MRIPGFSRFVESIAHRAINEATIYLSPRMRVALGDIKSSISDRMLGLQGAEVKPDVTIVDMGKPGYVTFTTQRNAVSKIDSAEPDSSPRVFGDDAMSLSANQRTNLIDSIMSSHDIQSPRQEMRIGKLINSLFPGEFGDRDRDQFVAQLTSLMETKGEEMSVVEGEMIGHWYDGVRYFNTCGSLGNSCMQDDNFFDIYEQNPGVCKMVILTELGRLKGRALIWKVNEWLPFEWVMDRRYTNYDHDNEKFLRYAKQNGWAYRTYNNYFSFKTFTWNNKVDKYDLSVTIRDTYDTYPYMDTFKTHNIYEGLLKNMGEGEEPGYFLESTEGDYLEIGNRWSEYHGEYLMDEDAVYSEPLRDWIRSRESVEVTVGSDNHRGRWPEDCQELVFDKLNDVYMHQDDAVHSNHLNDYILREDAIAVLKSVEGNLSVGVDYVRDVTGLLDMREFSGQGCDWWRAVAPKLEGLTHALPESFRTDWKGRWVPRSLMVKTFRSEKDPGVYLMDDDAKELGVEVDDSKEAERWEDVCGYCTRLSRQGLLESLPPKSRQWCERFVVPGQQGSVEGSSSSPD